MRFRVEIDQIRLRPTIQRDGSQIDLREKTDPNTLKTDSDQTPDMIRIRRKPRSGSDKQSDPEPTIDWIRLRPDKITALFFSSFNI